ncbi:ser/threonine protein phosphatase [Spirochaetia bacterium]|nr:ser/threonine protein phosphatase [Spirochaetia bacterium]
MNLNKNPTHSGGIIGFLRTLAAVGFLAGLISCRTISISSYTVQTPGMAAENLITIALISDLHSTIYGGDQRPLIELIAAQRPDLILLSGDIVDDKTPVTGTTLLLAGIRDLAPIFYVTGNHEYMSKRIGDIRHTLESFGVVILSDSYVQLDIRGNAVIVAGVEDPYKKIFETPGYDQNLSMRRAFGALDKIAAYKILIAHRPENIKAYAEYPFDLVVSGHAHGGQVRIPHVLNGLYAPGQGLFPRYAGGRYTHGSLTHIVSRGLSVDPWIPRIFNPPELVIIFVGSNL